MALELLLCGESVSEELVNDVVNEQMKREMESDVNEDEEEELNVSFLKTLYRVFRLSFRQRTENVIRQILSCLRIGEEYLKMLDFYNHAAICLNGAMALCVNEVETEEGNGMLNLSEALEWQISISIRKAIEQARIEEKDFTKLKIRSTDGAKQFEKTHYAFCGKLALSSPDPVFLKRLRNEVGKNFITDVVDTIQRVLFDDD